MFENFIYNTLISFLQSLHRITCTELKISLHNKNACKNEHFPTCKEKQ